MCIESLAPLLGEADLFGILFFGKAAALQHRLLPVADNLGEGCVVVVEGAHDGATFPVVITVALTTGVDVGDDALGTTVVGLVAEVAVEFFAELSAKFLGICGGCRGHSVLVLLSRSRI